MYYIHQESSSCRKGWAVADTQIKVVQGVSADMAAQADQAAGLMKALSNPARLLILCMLVEGEKSVAELEAGLNTSQPNVSQHLARLRFEGWVSTKRDGRMVYYSISDPRVELVLTALHDAFCPTEA